ncbi:MAG: acyltransferase, partial [Alphaproteobacteria bacterium]|nr:acyltransferase [Alphaproteobacteria bacterium]
IAKVAPGRVPHEFMLSRITRVVPLYFLFTIPSMLMQFGTSGFGWRNLLATFCFLPATDVVTLPALHVGWTLCFEMLFYGCAALVLLDRRFLVALVAAYGVASLLRPAGAVFQFVGNPIILEFLFGVAIAFAPRNRLGIWALPCGIILLLAAGLTGTAPTAAPALAADDGLRRVLVYGIPALLIVYGCLQIKARESRWTYLGEASYSLYVSHILLISPSFALWKMLHAPADLIVVACVGGALVLAWRTHELIEKPIARMLRRREFRQRTPLEADGALSGADGG